MIYAPFRAFALYSAKFFSAFSIADHRGFCKRFFNIFLSVFPSLPLIAPDGAAYLVDKVFGNGAGGITQVVEDSRGRKLYDPGKVLVLQIVHGVQTAAGEDGVLDAGGQEISETHFQIEIIQILQQTALRVVGEVLQMLPVDFIGGAFSLLHEHPANVPFLRGAVLTLQRPGNGGVVILPKLPQVGCPRPSERAGVCHVKDEFQMWLTTVLVDQSNARGPRFYPAPHGIVPQLHGGASSSVRALGVDQDLVIETIFVDTGGNGQVPFPFVNISRDVMGGPVRQFGYSTKARLGVAFTNKMW